MNRTPISFTGKSKMHLTSFARFFLFVLILLITLPLVAFASTGKTADALTELALVIAFGAVPTVTAAAAAEKWARRAAGATPDYTSGVQNPSVDWATATKSSEDNYKTAVVAAASAGRFGKGVQKAGSSKWQQGAIVKGSARWAPGIQASEASYQQGIGEVLSTVASLNLPPRRVKGDPSNLQRVAMVANALHQKAIQNK